MSQGPLDGCSVLVVEDDFYLAEDARETLEKAGATVLGPFRDAADGLRLAEQARPHCAVLDLNLGEGPAFGPARTLRAQGVPVLFVTGYDAEVVPPDLSDVQRLEKPIVPARLITAVARLCGGAGDRLRPETDVR